MTITNSCATRIGHLARRFWITSVMIVRMFPVVSAQLPEGDVFGMAEDVPHQGTYTTERSLATPYLLGGAALFTVISLQYDQEIADYLISWKENNAAVRSVSPVVTEMGSGGFTIGVLGTFGAYGYMADDPRAIRVAKLGAASFLVTGLAVQLVKQLSGRERPETSQRPGGFWHGPFAMLRENRDRSKGIGSYDAFASGHTTTAFSLATVLSDVYDDRPWVGYVSYSLATVVAVSRVTERTHWISDCIVGAVIGTYGTKFVMDFLESSPSVSIDPDFINGEYAFCLSVTL